MVEHFKTQGLDVGVVETVEATYVTPLFKTGVIVYIGFGVEVYEYDLTDKSISQQFFNGKETGEYPWVWHINEVATKRGVSNGSLLLTGYEGHPDENKILNAFTNFNN